MSNFRMSKLDSTDGKQDFFHQGEIMFYNGCKSQVIIIDKIYMNKLTKFNYLLLKFKSLSVMML